MQAANWQMLSGKKLKPYKSGKKALNVTHPLRSFAISGNAG